LAFDQRLVTALRAISDAAFQAALHVDGHALSSDHLIGVPHDRDRKEISAQFNFAQCRNSVSAGIGKFKRLRC
jgi:hypothetical protein